MQNRRGGVPDDRHIAAGNFDKAAEVLGGITWHQEAPIRSCWRCFGQQLRQLYTARLAIKLKGGLSRGAVGHALGLPRRSGSF
ncbi:MAG: hypothetical protein ACLRWQ_01785 [Flavonifractor plautii]